MASVACSAHVTVLFFKCLSEKPNAVSIFCPVMMVSARLSEKSSTKIQSSRSSDSAGFSFESKNSMKSSREDTVCQGYAVSIRSARIRLALGDELRYSGAATSIGSAPFAWRPNGRPASPTLLRRNSQSLAHILVPCEKLVFLRHGQRIPRRSKLEKVLERYLCGIGRTTQWIFKMRHCHLAAFVRDDNVINGRFGRGHTAFALSLVTDMTEFLVRATRRELDARSIVTSKLPCT